MSRWDILLDRTNQAKIKTDYVNEVNKENEKNIGKKDVTMLRINFSI